MPTSAEIDAPRPGVMHEVDEAFYRLTVAQRDAAWAESERRRRTMADALEALQNDHPWVAENVLRAALNGGST